VDIEPLCTGHNVEPSPDPLLFEWKDILENGVVGDTDIDIDPEDVDFRICWSGADLISSPR